MTRCYLLVNWENLFSCMSATLTLRWSASLKGGHLITWYGNQWLLIIHMTCWWQGLWWWIKIIIWKVCGSSSPVCHPLLHWKQRAGHQVPPGLTSIIMSIMIFFVTIAISACISYHSSLAATSVWRATCGRTSRKMACAEFSKRGFVCFACSSPSS